MPKGKKLPCRPSVSSPRHLTRLLLPALLLAVLLSAAPAPANELDLGRHPRRPPFDSPYSSGPRRRRARYLRHRPASGGGQTSAAAGLIWLHRDPDTGKLVFGRNYLSDRERPMVYGAELSQFENFVYVLLAGSRGNLPPPVRRLADVRGLPWSCPGTLRPQSIRRLSHGGVLVDGLDGGAILQDFGDGFLNLAASLDNTTGRTGRELLAPQRPAFRLRPHRAAPPERPMVRPTR